MTADYYKVEVQMKSNDTLDDICKRFEQNSEKLYAICIAILKQLSQESLEKVLISVVENQYESSKNSSTIEQRLEKFTVTTKDYRKNILDKNEEFFKDLGNILLEERKADIDEYMSSIQLPIPVNVELLITKVKDMIGRINLVDEKCKNDIWRLMCNMVKLTEKYRIIKGYSNTKP